MNYPLMLDILFRRINDGFSYFNNIYAANEAAVEADSSLDKVTYDFFVSTTPAENIELMKKTYDGIGPWPLEVHYISSF